MCHSCCKLFDFKIVKKFNFCAMLNWQVFLAVADGVSWPTAMKNSQAMTAKCVNNSPLLSSPSPPRQSFPLVSLSISKRYLALPSLLAYQCWRRCRINMHLGGTLCCIWRHKLRPPGIAGRHLAAGRRTAIETLLASLLYKK